MHDGTCKVCGAQLCGMQHIIFGCSIAQGLMDASTAERVKLSAFLAEDVIMKELFLAGLMPDPASLGPKPAGGDECTFWSKDGQATTYRAGCTSMVPGRLGVAT